MWKQGYREHSDLTEKVIERQSLNAHILHFLHLLLIEVFHLIHGYTAISIQIHTSEPVLYTAISYHREIQQLLVGRGRLGGRKGRKDGRREEKRERGRKGRKEGRKERKKEREEKRGKNGSEIRRERRVREGNKRMSK